MTIPASFHRPVRLFCCRCLKDQPVEGGAHRGNDFICAACLAALKGAA